MRIFHTYSVNRSCHPKITISSDVDKEISDKVIPIVSRMQNFGAGDSHIENRTVFSIKTPETFTYILISIDVLAKRFPILSIFNEPICRLNFHDLMYLEDSVAKIQWEASHVEDIVNKHICQPDSSISMLNCQDELIERGLAEWAKM